MSAIISTMTKNTVEIIRAYLDGLGTSDKPVVDKEAVRALKGQIKIETDPINKLKLLTQLEQEEEGHVPDRTGDQAAFVAHAKDWAEAEGVSASALLTLGVSEEVLVRAGFEVVAVRGAGRRTAARPGGARAPRIPLEEVKQAASGLGEQWKLSELSEQVERDATTTRNYVRKLIDAGEVVEVGEDPAHDGRGRAPKLYRMA